MMIVHNFSAGPASLPKEVLQKAQENISDFQGVGYSIMEASHRGSVYSKVHERAIDLLRELLALPKNYHIVLVGGGATLQFSMVPLNFLKKQAAYVASGAWGTKAIAEAKKHGDVRLAYDGSVHGYTELPATLDTAALDKDYQDGKLDYLHITTNETINGIQWHSTPALKHCPLVADMSSDILSQNLPMEAFSCIYASAQKNIGTAGVTIAILNEEFLNQQVSEALPSYLDYKVHVKSNSLYNTPPAFSIYMLMLALEWVQKKGGISSMETASKQRSEMIYAITSQYQDVYQVPAKEANRSHMNIVFKLRDKAMEEAFLKSTAEQGFIGLNGHRSVGGCRASMYNFVSEQSVEALAAFMKTFAESQK